MGHMLRRLKSYTKFAQQRASIQQESTEAQALQGKEALLADIVEEEMVHWAHVLVLSQIHLQQAKEIMLQSNEIRHLSTLLENSRLSWRESQEQQRQIQEMPVPQNPTSCIKELQREAFNILPGMANATQDAGSVHTFGISQDISVTGRAHSEKELAEEPHGCCTVTGIMGVLGVHFASDPQGDLHLPPENILRREDPKPALILLHIHPDMK